MFLSAVTAEKLLLLLSRHHYGSVVFEMEIIEVVSSGSLFVTELEAVDVQQSCTSNRSHCYSWCGICYDNYKQRKSVGKLL
jgi:hypothetical protein